MIVDIIVFQHSMAIVIEVNPHLLNETTEERYTQNDERVDGQRSRFSPHVSFSSIGVSAACSRTCFPLCILFLLSTGVLPVVTHTPASVLLYTSFSSMTPCPFSCCVTRSHTLQEFTAKVIKDRHNIYHVYSTVLAVMDLVVSDNWTAVCPDLDSCQGIAVDVISFDEAPTVTENINATLIAIENGIAPI